MLPPESDLGRSDGLLVVSEVVVSIVTNCHGRTDARRIMVMREVVGAGISKSSSREVYVDDRSIGTVIFADSSLVDWCLQKVAMI